MWERLGSPPSVSMVEIGPGKGTLMAVCTLGFFCSCSQIGSIVSLGIFLHFLCLMPVWVCFCCLRGDRES